MESPDLTDRTVLVTGSARGVGRELLLSTASRGARTAVHYNSSDEAAETVAEMALEQGATDAMTVQADITDPDDVTTMIDEIEAELGPVDILVNNVGDFAPTHWADIPFETWNRVLETNLNGTYLCSKAVLPGMRDREYGRIVNIGYASSEKGLVSPKNFPYFVAKTGVIMFTRMLAADTQDDGITVNAVSPYVVENSDEFPDELPRGKAATFDDLSGALLYFLSEQAAYVSGQNIEVDGGWLPETV